MKFEHAEYRRYIARRALLLMKSEFEASSWQACWKMVVEGRPAADVASRWSADGQSLVFLCRGRAYFGLASDRHLKAFAGHDESLGSY